MTHLISKKPILLIGQDIRYLAENAVRHGHNVTVIDHAGAWDTAKLCSAFSIHRDGVGNDLDLRQLIDLARKIENNGIVVGSGFENDILALAKVGEVGLVIGPSLATVRKVRNPESLVRTARAWGFEYPEIAYDRDSLDAPDQWLAKPLASLGGKGIILADKVPAGSTEGLYFQRYVKGIASSAAVVSDGSEAFVLGSTAQIVGDERFGSSGYQFTGGIYPHPFAEEIRTQLENIADALTLEFDLKGLWGFDFIYNGSVTVIEINPRPTYAHGLVGSASWNDLLGLHMDSSSKKSSNLIIDPGPPAHTHAFARIYAREDTLFSGAAGWYSKGARDLARDGDFVAAGESLLTIHVEEDSYTRAVAALRHEADEVYQSFIGNTATASL
jgi:predicted ATP-grasp superfamily ATP-dependent carboligase